MNWIAPRFESDEGEDVIPFSGSLGWALSVDKISIGPGRRGPVVRRLQEAFFAYINGGRDDTYHGLTFI